MEEERRKAKVEGQYGLEMMGIFCVKKNRKKKSKKNKKLKKEKKSKKLLPSPPPRYMAKAPLCCFFSATAIVFLVRAIKFDRKGNENKTY